MAIIPTYVDMYGFARPEWKTLEQFHIFTKTTLAGKVLDLVFLSGYTWFDFGSSDENWVNESLIISFKDLLWSDTPEVQVVPVVSLGSMENIQTDETETIGWGILSTKVDLIPAAPTSKTIQLTSGITVRGTDSHLKSVTYYVTAMGSIGK